MMVPIAAFIGFLLSTLASYAVLQHAALEAERKPKRMSLRVKVVFVLMSFTFTLSLLGSLAMFLVIALFLGVMGVGG